MPRIWIAVALTRRLTIGLFVAVSALACSDATVESRVLPDGLPERIGGVEIIYNTTSGLELDPDRWPGTVAKALNVPLDRLTYVTGYRDDRGTYNSDIIQVRGVGTEDLLKAVLPSLPPWTGERWEENIAGKTVQRVLPEGSDGSVDGIYFYAFEDVVVVILGDRTFVEEGLRSLP